MNILVIENYSAKTQILVEGLNEATGCSIYHVPTLSESPRVLKEHNPYLITADLDDLALSPSAAVGQIRSAAATGSFAYPHVFLLGSSFPKPSEAAICRELEAVFLRRDFLEQVYYEARTALWLRRQRKYRWSIRFERHSAELSLHLCSYTSSGHIAVGSQLTRLAVSLAGQRAAYTAQAIADELGVCRQTVKKYMNELSRATDLIFDAFGLPRERIFWMERRPGGTLCGMRANVVWGQS